MVFRDGLARLNRDLQGEAKLEMVEQDLKLLGSVDKLGHLHWTGELMQVPGSITEVRLCFTIEDDQTSLGALIQQVDAIIEDAKSEVQRRTGVPTSLDAPLVEGRRREEVDRKYSSTIDAIRTILLSQWNPIGFPVPDDEYDRYAPSIARMLFDVASANEISDKLRDFEALIGVETSPSLRLAVAQALKSIAIN
ncbi:MAG TPA: hypothetical protein VKR56_01910 [Candidatus Cybelea sp.]|nr:hypothetical protein [Candidatus Cybelea sp.]